jgi:transcriptional regulator with XRE-family HTH domain
MAPITLRIRELREARGWSQVHLGRQAGVNQATISRIENGQTTGIDFATLEALARALEVDPGYLIVRAPERVARRKRGK